MKEGYEVLVLNTNLNRWPDGSQHKTKATPITENKSPVAHASYVWRHLIVQRAKAKHIAVVAFSYGGVVVTHLATQESDAFLPRVFAVALTDCVHRLHYEENVTDRVMEFFAQRVRNWVSSDEELDEPIAQYCDEVDAPQFSTGHRKHAWTSYSSFESVLKFFDKQYRKGTAVASGEVDGLSASVAEETEVASKL